MAGAKKNIAILLLGGSGLRFGGDTPKQFLPVGGRALFCYPLSVLAASPEVEEILLVAKKGTEEKARELASPFANGKLGPIVTGGASRKESVRNALEFLSLRKESEDSLVLIQDGDRPELTESLIKRNYEVAKAKGAAVTAIPCSDSIFLSQNKEDVDRYWNRDLVYRAQTPQTFRFALILEAHRQGKEATDDASLVRSLGKEVGIVLGSEENLKINTPSDLEFWKKRRDMS